MFFWKVRDICCVAIGNNDVVLENNIKTNLKDIMYEHIDRIPIAQGRDQWLSSVNTIADYQGLV
jgi:hypothetical protein